MNYKRVKSFLENIQIDFFENYSTAALNSFEIGGAASIVVFPKTRKKLCSILRYIRSNNIKFFLIGNGTNVFFSDKPFDGVIISTKHLNKILFSKEILIAECGALISECSLLAMFNSFEGLESLFGIPGSVGGAVYMNAEAYGRSVSDVVFESEVFDLNTGTTRIINREEHLFDRKRSIFSNKNNLIILNTSFLLKSANSTFLKSYMLEIGMKRIKSQPLFLGNGGSAFKRPVGTYASKLIDEAGMKGYKIGGAAISNKHAGFLVNHSNATSEDILKLLDKTKESVISKYGIRLEEEIIFVE